MTAYGLKNAGGAAKMGEGHPWGTCSLLSPRPADDHLQDVWESQLTWRVWVSQQGLSFLQVSYLSCHSIVLGEPCFSLCDGGAHTPRWWGVYIWESRRPPVIPNRFYMDI